jgi:hypothetical protein
MAAEQRDDEPPRLVDHDHRRLRALVGDERCQQADDDADRGNRDDRPAGAEGGDEIGRGRAGDGGITQGRDDALGQRGGPRAQMPDDVALAHGLGPARIRAK